MAADREVPRAPASAVIPVRLAPEELARIERAVGLLGLRSRSEFYRSAALARLDEIERGGVLEVRDATVEDAMNLIDRQLRERPGTHYVSDLVEGLGIEPAVVFEAAERLIHDGRARSGRRDQSRPTRSR